MDEKLRAVIAGAYERAPAVRERFDDAGLLPADIQTVADLQKLPVFAKDDLVARQQADPPFGGMLGVPRDEVRHIFLSPGPIYEVDGGDDDTILRMMHLALRQSGFGPGDTVLNTLSYHLVPAGLHLDQALVEMGCTVIPGGVGNSDLQLKLLEDLQATGYAGTPSFLMSLIQKSEDQGKPFRHHFRLEKAFVTAEPLPPSLRQRLTGDYGIQIGNAYGTAELGVLALSTGPGLALQLLPEPIVELVDPETGQVVAAGAPGEVVVTLLNPAYPLLRLGTGDMAINGDPAPGSSRQEERTIILVGRSGEAVKVRGMFVHPNQLRFAVGQVVQAAAVQGVVTRAGDRDVFTVRVALQEDSDTGELAARLKEAVRQVCRVSVDDVRFIGPDEIGAEERGMLDERTWA
ncbi:MAG: AMP-binding protein [Anaerolineae bacterium]|nr:AMP-binding protein [Anaerolineae bacterium]